MIRLVITNLLHRPLRTFLTAVGIAIALAVILLVDQVGAAYRAQLLKEVHSMGIHLMLVPLGCPYDAAARVLKGNTLETSLPESAVEAAANDPDVELAAPLLMAAIPRPSEGRTDMFVGIDERGIALKRWWKPARGAARFTTPDSIIPGADAAQAEMREVGDSFYSPEMRREFKVAGILERSGTSDDSLFFVPLRTAQQMFDSTNRVTAVAIRLRDPATLTAVSSRLREIPGAQVVTQTEMTGTFLNILGTIRTLLQTIGWVALVASVAGLMNTLLMSVAERAFEFSLFRAIGASRSQIFAVVSLESLLVTASGIGGGIAVCLLLESTAFRFSSTYLALQSNAGIRLAAIALSLGVGLFVAILASLFPAWRAARVQPAAVLKGGE
jgi:putative ABC transport system permease protein